jgi:hypothetical protein
VLYDRDGLTERPPDEEPRAWSLHREPGGGAANASPAAKNRLAASIAPRINRRLERNMAFLQPHRMRKARSRLGKFD